MAAVHGAVAGGGLGLIYVADIVLAAEGTRFATGFAGLGVSGDGGSTWFLPRLVGARRAAELYFSQRVLDADEALEWGLITRIVPPNDLVAEARDGCSPARGRPDAGLRRDQDPAAALEPGQPGRPAAGRDRRADPDGGDPGRGARHRELRRQVPA